MPSSCKRLHCKYYAPLKRSYQALNKLDGDPKILSKKHVMYEGIFRRSSRVYLDEGALSRSCGSAKNYAFGDKLLLYTTPQEPHRPSMTHQEDGREGEGEGGSLRETPPISSTPNPRRSSVDCPK